MTLTRDAARSVTTTCEDGTDLDVAAIWYLLTGNMSSIDLSVDETWLLEFDRSLE